MIGAWRGNMRAVQAAIVARGGFDWQSFRAVRTPGAATDGKPANATVCAQWMREACQQGSQVAMGSAVILKTRCMLCAVVILHTKQQRGSGITMN